MALLAPSPTQRRADATAGWSLARALVRLWPSRRPRPLDLDRLSDHWRRDLGLESEVLRPRNEGLLDWARLERYR